MFMDMQTEIKPAGNTYRHGGGGNDDGHSSCLIISVFLTTVLHTWLQYAYRQTNLSG